MRVLKTVAIKHPKYFSNVFLSVSAHRDVFMFQANGENPIIDIVTSEVITLEEFKEYITVRFGELKHCETYVDPEDGMDVIRGIVVHHGIQKCFIQRYDELTLSLMKDVVKALELTKKVDTTL